MRVSVLRYDFLHNSPSIIAGALYRNQDTIMTIDSFVSFSFDNSKETIIRSGVYHLKCNFRNTLNRLIILHAEHRFLCAISYTLKRFEPFNRRRRSLVHMKAKVSVPAPQWTNLAIPRRYTFQVMPWPGFAKFSKHRYFSTKISYRRYT